VKDQNTLKFSTQGHYAQAELLFKQACQGRDGRKYPWGNSFGSGNANIDDSGDGYKKTSPVGSFPGGASPYGAMDMSGNVWEWTSSLYDKLYPEIGGSFFVLHGGAWSRNANHARCEYRVGDLPGPGGSSSGFRCAR